MLLLYALVVCERWLSATNQRPHFVPYCSAPGGSFLHGFGVCVLGVFFFFFGSLCTPRYNQRYNYSFGHNSVEVVSESALSRGIASECVLVCVCVCVHPVQQIPPSKVPEVSLPLSSPCHTYTHTHTCRRHCCIIGDVFKPCHLQPAGRR